VTWHRSGAAIAESGALLAAPIAEAEDGPVYPGELPYPSAVTGASPAGAPVTVSWAAAGVADKTAQTAAVDRNVKTKCFIRLSPVIDRERSKSRDSQRQPCSLEVMSGPLCTKEACRGESAGLLSVASLFGRSSRSFTALLKISGNILQDDLDKTIVAYALALGETRGQVIAIRAPRRQFHAAPSDGIALAYRRAHKKAWAPSILNACKSGRNKTKIRHKEIKARHNKIQAWCNKIQIRRNEIQIALPSMNLGFSTGYRRFRPAFAGYDICVSGPLRSESSARAGKDPFFRSRPSIRAFGKKNI
jgi:hypothetical protein